MRRRIELARSESMRTQWNRGLDREIYVPRRPEEDERREMKKIDIYLKTKQEQSRIGVGFFRNFGDEIPQKPQTTNENRDTESTTSSNTEEAVTIHEPGSYPAKPV